MPGSMLHSRRILGFQRILPRTAKHIAPSGLRYNEMRRELQKEAGPLLEPPEDSYTISRLSLIAQVRTKL